MTTFKHWTAGRWINYLVPGWITARVRLIPQLIAGIKRSMDKDNRQPSKWDYFWLAAMIIWYRGIYSESAGQLLRLVNFSIHHILEWETHQIQHRWCGDRYLFVYAPPAKAGGFLLRLKAALIGHPSDGCRYTTSKSSSCSGRFWCLIYSSHTSSVTCSLDATRYPFGHKCWPQ